MEFLPQLGDPAYQRIGATLVVIVVAVILNQIAQRILYRYVTEPESRFKSTRATTRVVAFVAFVLIVGIWAPSMRGVLAVLTVVGAGLAIAMRETLLSLVGWIHIMTRIPYKNGDRIEINDIRGDVIDVRILHTTLIEIGDWVEADQSTGRLMQIPNSWVFQFALKNYTRGFNFIWNELALTVTFRSDWEAARQIMLTHANESTSIIEKQAAREIKEMSRAYLVHYGILTPFVYVKVVENGVRLTLRYLCEVRKRRGTEHALTISILRAFAERQDIELAYPMVGVAPFSTPQFGPIPSQGDAFEPVK